MERFVKGDIVVVPFPFSDLSTAKRRPSMVIADLQGQDIILAQITSQTIHDQYAIRIQESDFAQGTLKVISNVRPNRLFTADKGIILYKVGTLHPEKIHQIINKIIDIIRS